MTRRATALVTLAALGVLAGCANGPASDPTEGTPVRGGTLRIAFWDDQQGCIDPNQVFWIESRSLDRQLADSLTDQDPATGAIVPWLATDWTIAPDARSYTFNLRHGVTFSDGAPLDAAAVKTALDGTFALGPKSVLGLTYLAGYQGTTVVDDDTVTVAFTRPNAAFLQATSTTTLAILSPKTYQLTPEERCTGKVVGSGPYTLDSYTAAKEAHLTRRPGYAWASPLVTNQGEVYLDAIDVSYIKEDSVRVGSLTSGAVDIAWPREPISEADQRLITATGGTIVSRPLPGISYSLFANVAKGGPLADLTVRQALQKAIDRTTYAKTIYWNDYPVVASVFDSTTPHWTDNSAGLAFDPTGAARLLDGAGWRLGGDGYRARDGKRLTLVEPVTVALAGDQLLQDQLKKVGIDLSLKVVTAAQRTEILAAGDYDVILTYLTRADPSVLGSSLDQAVSKQGTATFSQDATTAARVSELFSRGLQATEPAQRGQVYADLQSYLFAQAVVFPVYERVQVAGLSPAVHGFSWTSEAFLRTNDLWLSR